MSYEDSFLSTCDAEGNVPSWAYNQIFKDHGYHNVCDFNDYINSTPEEKIFNGRTILNWLGY